MEDGLAQALGALEIGVNDRFKFIDYREAALHLGYNSLLFVKRW
jgi:hypothetical protein